MVLQSRHFLVVPHARRRRATRTKAPRRRAAGAFVCVLERQQGANAAPALTLSAADSDPASQVSEASRGPPQVSAPNGVWCWNQPRQARSAKPAKKSRAAEAMRKRALRGTAATQRYAIPYSFVCTSGAS